MIEGIISSWASSIVISIIVATIIEMILPESKNKKYVKTVIGVFILFTIISPIITKISGEKLSFETLIADANIDSIKTKEVANLNTTKSIENLYINNLKGDLINRLKEKGYKAKELNIAVNMQEGDNYGKINKISFRLGKSEGEEKDGVSIVNEISINIDKKDTIENKEDITKDEYDEIAKYIAQTYQINKDIINIY